MIVKIEEVEEKDLTYVVIIALFKGQYIFCLNQKRGNGYEFPGGKIEEGETALMAAHRELQEETAAIDYHLEEITSYSVYKDDMWSHGKLYYAEVFSFGSLKYEIEKIEFFNEVPERWNFKEIQSVLLEAYLKRNLI